MDKEVIEPVFSSPLEWLEASSNESESEHGNHNYSNDLIEPVEIHGATPLSLAEILGPSLLPAATPLSLAEILAPSPPPGLGFAAEEGNHHGPLPPPGLTSRFAQKGAEAAKDGGGSCMGEEGDRAQPTTLVLSEVSHLNAKSPMFCPMLSPSTVKMLMPDVRKPPSQPARTKLRAKADVYVPGGTAAPMAAGNNAAAKPFVPMAPVNESWQTWHMKDSSFDVQNEKYYSEQDTFKDMAVNDISDWYAGY